MSRWILCCFSSLLLVLGACADPSVLSETSDTPAEPSADRPFDERVGPTSTAPVEHVIGASEELQELLQVSLQLTDSYEQPPETPVDDTPVADTPVADDPAATDDDPVRPDDDHGSDDDSDRPADDDSDDSGDDSTTRPPRTGGDPIRPVDPAPSCEADDLEFSWPMPGTDARDWVINNYVDLDRNEGTMRDYAGNTNGAARTYDNHRGIDIDAPTFRSMDEDFPIIAAAAGEVIALAEGNFDRNMTCTGNWNYVKVLHDNGFTAYYGHLKQDSVVVEIGDRVETGDTLGVIGSSGCSSHVHLHFQVHDCDDNIVDPFREGMWDVPPVYITQLGLMDISLRRGQITQANDIKDPPPNVSLIRPGETLGLGLSIGGGVPGDKLTLTVQRPDGSTANTLVADFTGFGRHSFRWFNLGVEDTPGRWTVTARANGRFEGSWVYGVTNLADDGSSQQVRHNVPDGDFQYVFDDVTTAGFQPVWVDGFTVAGAARFNAIFRRSDGFAWASYNKVPAGDYQGLMDYMVSTGYRPTYIDSYALSDNVFYSVVFTQRPGPDWAAYHGLTEVEAGVRFGELRAAGFRPAMISPVVVGGQTYVSGLWDNASVGGWEAWYAMNSDGYQTAFIDYTEGEADLRLNYLNVYTDAAGNPAFSAIWSGTGYGGYVARHAMSADDFQSEFEAVTYDAPYFGTEIVTGYDDGYGNAAFGALFTQF